MNRNDVFSTAPRGETTGRRSNFSGGRAARQQEPGINDALEEIGNMFISGIGRILGEPSDSTLHSRGYNPSPARASPPPSVPPPGPNSGYLFDSADQLPNYNPNYTPQRPSFYDVPPTAIPSYGNQRGPSMKAVIVGCNYPMSAPEKQLRACVSDALNWAHVLQEHFGFHQESIACLLDVDSYGQPVLETDGAYPSRENVMDNLDWLIEDTHPGDVRVFIYAGHGTQVPDEENDDDAPLAVISSIFHRFDTF